MYLYLYLCTHGWLGFDLQSHSAHSRSSSERNGSGIIVIIGSAASGGVGGARRATCCVPRFISARALLQAVAGASESRACSSSSSTAAAAVVVVRVCVCVCVCVCMRCVRCGASMFECNRFCVLDGVHNALWVSQAINIEGEWNMLKEAHCEARAAVRLELHYANALRLVGCLGGGPTVVHFAGHCDDINASNRGLVLEQDGEGVVAWVRVALPAK
jgi:hypothetical protein